MTSRYFTREEIEAVRDKPIDTDRCILPDGLSLQGVGIDHDLYAGCKEDLAPCVTVVLSDGTRYPGKNCTGDTLYFCVADKEFYRVPIGHYLIVALEFSDR